MDHAGAPITLRVDDLSGEPAQALLRLHLAGMRANTPPEHVFALDWSGLKAPGITVWTAWRDDAIAGIGALRTIDATHGEIKSMRTTEARRRSGVGRAMLMHIIDEATRRGYRRLSLETGSQPEFVPAHRLYRDTGFVDCAPFADYRPDPNSVFMTLDLTVADTARPATRD